MSTYRDDRAESELSEQFEQMDVHSDNSDEDMESVYRQLVLDDDTRAGSAPPVAFSRETTLTLDDEMEVDRIVGDGSVIDYMNDDFPWSEQLEECLRTRFGIQNFRYCQRGICNASMDNQSIISILPTGGGKSLTYQLPALLSRGITVVISPLISLMIDQTTQLQELGVPASMLTSVNHYEHLAIYHKLEMLIEGQTEDAKIKLLYLSPEMLFSSNEIFDKLVLLAQKGLLARFVLDEAHNIIEIGQSFRKACQLLETLHTNDHLCNVPFTATTATNTISLLKSIAFQFKRKTIYNGQAPISRAYLENSALFFRAPLDRRNLSFKVMLKSSFEDFLKAVTAFILQKHINHAGIIFCQSIKMTEAVAQKLITLSGGRIQTAFYHSKINSMQKLDIINKWKRNKIQVICTTPAFGLGIHKSDVYFIIHHTMPDSLTAYYQEAGRGGRDGNPTDCIIFYKPTDFTKLSGLVTIKSNGLIQLCQMAAYCQNLASCRNTIFAQHFMETPHTLWKTNNDDLHTPCHHCDNCIYNCPQAKDCTLITWELMHIIQEILSNYGRLPITTLETINTGQITYNTYSSSQRYDIKKTLVIKSVPAFQDHSPIICNITSFNIAWLCIHLVLTQYLLEDHYPTIHDIKTYFILGPKGKQLKMCTKDDIMQGRVEKVEISFWDKTQRAQLNMEDSSETETDNEDSSEESGEE